MSYAIQCKECGKWSAKEIKNIIKANFKCTYCRKSTKIKKKNEYGLSLNIKGPYKTPDTPKIIAELNRRK